MTERDNFVAENMSELIKHKMKRNYDGCVKISESLLRETGHIPIVTNVAMGVGFCSFYAKLTEFIGVKSWLNFMVDRFSGKGKDVHRLMGLTCLEVFPSPQSLEEAYKVIDRIAEEDLEFKTEDDKTLAIGASKSLIKNLLDGLNKLCELTGADRGSLYPIVEQQFVDYDLHMRGIPDLILEDRGNGKAIVIDWKTASKSGKGSITVYNNEDAQVIAYSLFEGSRLEKEDIRSSVTSKNGHVDVLPVIVRTGDTPLWSPNPILSGDTGEKSLDKYEKLVSNVFLEAQYLTTLLAYSRKEKLSPGEISLCKAHVNWSERPQNMLTIMPDQFWKRGVPSKQEKYPCIWGSFECAVKDSCHFYYGRGIGVKKDYESDMWALRYKTLKKKEDSLVAYRAIHDIFKYHRSPLQGYSAIDWINKGKGFAYPGGGGMAHSIDRPQIIGPSGEVVSRIDIVDDISFDQEEEDFVLQAKRPIRDYEAEDYYVIPTGKTILATFMDAWSPFLSISLFGNIREIIPEEGYLTYTISVPSKIFRYQMQLFKKYLMKHGLKAKLYMFELGADLTQIELSAIDALQQLLDPENANQDIELDPEQVEQTKREEAYLSSDEEEKDAGENASVLMDIFRNIAEISSRKKRGD